VTRKLHPAGIAVLGARSLRGAAVPLVVAAVAFGRDGALGSLLGALSLTLLAAGAAAFAGYVTWRTVTYTVTDRAVVARRGLLATKETVVPLERVQALDTVQGPLQRLLGVTAVHVQAAGGGKEGEIVLEALSAQAVAELRERVGSRAATAPTRAAADPARRLSARRLAVVAVTAGQFGVIVPLLAAASQVADDLLLGDDGPDAGLLDRLPETPSEAAVAVAVLVGVAWALSMAGAVVAFAGFTLAREGDRLRIRRGLLARREASVPLGRVQAVTFVEGLLRAPFGFGSLRVEVAGYAAEASAAQVLHPLVRRREVEPLLAELLPAFAGPLGPLERPPARALTRYVRAPAAVGFLAAAGLVVAGAAALAPLPVLLGLAYGIARRSATGVRAEAGRVVLRARRLARRTVIVRGQAVQDGSLIQSPLQRRARLAGLRVRAGAGTSVRLDHLEAAVARGAFEAVAGARGGAREAP